jgi:hypothetical protein
VFDYVAGSFTEYRDGILYLGDGEEKLFHLEISEPNAQINNLQVEWIDGHDVNTRRTQSGGKITLAKENIDADTGKQMWRIKHDEDYKEGGWWMITRDLKYKTWEEYSESYLHETSTYQNFESDYSYYYSQQTLPSSPVNYYNATDPNTGVTRWYLNRFDSDNYVDGHTSTLSIRCSFNPADITIANGKPETLSSRSSVALPVEYGSYDRVLHDIDSDGSPLSYYYTVTYYTRVTGTRYTDKYCQSYYVSVTPYVLDDAAFKSNPNYYHGEFKGYRDHFNLLGIQDSHEDLNYPATVLHQYAVETTTKDEGVSAEYDTAFVISYQRFNGDTVTFTYPVKVQKRICEAYSKGAWRYTGDKYVFQQQ